MISISCPDSLKPTRILTHTVLLSYCEAPLLYLPLLETMQFSFIALAFFSVAFGAYIPVVSSETNQLLGDINVMNTHKDDHSTSNLDDGNHNLNIPAVIVGDNVKSRHTKSLYTDIPQLSTASSPVIGFIFLISLQEACSDIVWYPSGFWLLHSVLVSRLEGLWSLHSDL